MPTPRGLSWPVRLLALLGSGVVAEAAFSCDKLEDSGAHWDLSALRGPHTVFHEVKTPPTITNVTWTIDLCDPLKIDKDRPAIDQCPEKTQVCGIEYVTHDNNTLVHKVVPVAGDFSSDSPLSPQILRLKKSPAKSDAGKEGLRLTLQGGIYPPDEKAGIKQKAVIDLLCDKSLSTRDDGGDVSADEGAKKFEISLKGYDEKEGLLTLEWKTKHACEAASGGSGGDGWGFFTWLFVILFFGTAAYLVFGSWVNYNRYGARGWDLLPHSDAIREFPYVVSDWGKRMFSTLQGGGMRGGYSAV